MQCKFFFNDTATTEIYTLSLHDALPICDEVADAAVVEGGVDPEVLAPRALEPRDALDAGADHVEALDLVPRHGFAVAAGPHALFVPPGLDAWVWRPLFEPRGRGRAGADDRPPHPRVNAPRPRALPGGGAVCD